MIIHKPGTPRAMAYHDRALYPVWAVVEAEAADKLDYLNLRDEELSEYWHFYSLTENHPYIHAYLTLLHEQGDTRNY